MFHVSDYLHHLLCFPILSLVVERFHTKWDLYECENLDVDSHHCVSSREYIQIFLHYSWFGIWCIADFIGFFVCKHPLSYMLLLCKEIILIPWRKRQNQKVPSLYGHCVSLSFHWTDGLLILWSWGEEQARWIPMQDILLYCACHC